MTAALQALQDQYDLLTVSLPDLLAACNGDATQENRVNAQYAAAEANYNKCVNKIFNDNDPTVQTLVAKLKKQQTDVAAQVKDIGDIAGVITAITSAVQTGASLAAKV
jgi:hypothetical protein